ncbi:MAG: 4-(cytidine 5'-diphospho)-2-C-methyl-D-erythritol kinase [Parcubacteria group bacterium]|jgi:4-diphosphocytidyl-2-C-methyl-D-erythritol kinase
MKTIKQKAPAKINLTLEIVKKLPNGYHELRTVMTKLESIFDEVTIKFYPDKSGIKIRSNSKKIPLDESNICHKAAEKYFSKIGKEIGIVIEIKKNIPIGAGLGGGSSDGAAVLKILNKYFKNKISGKELEAMASEVGKDVPIFLSPKNSAFLDRMGDRIKKNADLSGLNFVIVNPEIHISTPWAFGEMHKYNNLGNKGISVKMFRYVQEKNTDKIINGLYNHFEPVIEKKYPIIKEIKNKLTEAGASGALMTGSGSTVFGIFKSKKDALKAKVIMKKHYPKFFVEVG